MTADDHDDAAAQRWITALAARLDGGGDPLLDADLERAVLALARDVAHGTYRRNAPLATFLAGRALERRVAAGAGAAEAVADVRAAISDASAAGERPPDR